MKRFHYDCKLQVYMYALIYVHSETITEEEYFPDTKTVVKNYKKISCQVSVIKHWFGFSYICLEYYELYLKFDAT